MVHRCGKFRSTLFTCHADFFSPHAVSGRSDATPAFCLTAFALCLPPAGAAWAEAAKDAAAGDLKAAQAQCASKSGAARDRCLTDAQTRGGKASIGPGQLGYVAPGAKGVTVISGSSKPPPHLAQARRTTQGLANTKLPSNQPTDVAKAAQQVKDAAKAGQ